jgi:hypothetical protein
MAGIEAYRRVLAQQERKLVLLMAGGRESAFGLALQRGILDVLRFEIQYPGSVLAWEKMGRDAQGFEGPDRWLQSALKKAAEKLSPSYGTDDDYTRKWEEYRKLANEILNWGYVRQELIEDKRAGKQYLIFGANPLVPKIMKVISDALKEWFDVQPRTKELMTWPAKAGLGTMLTERPDLAALLRISDTLPVDHETSDIPVDRPAMVEAVEFAIGLIPVVGNVVAAYEAWSGEDLFGYKLGDVERGILAACVLLPVAGRLAKGGRALYTEARLVRLYGRDAAAWQKVMAASSRGYAERKAIEAVGKAERALRVEKKLAKDVAKEAADAVPALTKGGAAASTAVDQAIVDLLADLRKAHPQLTDLDELALRRILEKGPNVDHLKGQVLEELIESRIVPWLKTREGGLALGLTIPAGKKLEFIPGHLIRDAASRQITDGMLVYREGEKLVIVAVFEAKAGKSAARELALKKGGISSLTEAERLELRAYAKDVWLEERDAAKAAGKAYKKTVEDLEKEFIQTEWGGQVRRDIERLSDGATIKVGGQDVAVELSPTKTKFFGVLPRDVNASAIEAQLKENKFAYEILGVDISAAKLKDMAASMKSLAESIAKAAP